MHIFPIKQIVGWNLKLREGGFGIFFWITCFWAVMAVVSSLQTYYVFSTMKEGPPGIVAIYLAFLFCLLWAAVTPLILLLARIFPLERSTLGMHLPLHLFFSVIVGVSVRLAFLLAQMIIPSVKPMRGLTLQRIMSDLVTSFDYQAMVYWVVLAIYQCAVYYRKYREGQLAASQLETQLVQAQLSGLRMQLQPHFLFNTLNTINAMIYECPDRASEMIVRLSEFLRLSLENNVQQEVPLSREIDFIERYLEIEHARFEDRLTVIYRVDAAAYDFLVPNLILQPLVENAIKHGIAPTTGGGNLWIGAKLRNERLTIFVANSGPFLASDPLKEPVESSSGRRGIGLANTSARLRALYGEAHTFELRNREEGGVEAVLSIPARAANQTELASSDQEEIWFHESAHRR